MRVTIKIFTVLVLSMSYSLSLGYSVSTQTHSQPTHPACSCHSNQQYLQQKDTHFALQKDFQVQRGDFNEHIYTTGKKYPYHDNCCRNYQGPGWYGLQLPIILPPVKPHPKPRP
jgi:hypothetical protein